MANEVQGKQNLSLWNYEPLLNPNFTAVWSRSGSIAIRQEFSRVLSVTKLAFLRVDNFVRHFERRFLARNKNNSRETKEQYTSKSNL